MGGIKIPQQDLAPKMQGAGGWLQDTIVMVIHSQITSSLNPDFVDLQNFDINLHAFSCFFHYKPFH